MNTEISTKSKKLSVKDLKEEERLEVLEIGDLDRVVGGVDRSVVKTHVYDDCLLTSMDYAPVDASSGDLATYLTV